MSIDSSKMKRIRLKPKNPNPIFEQWLNEWHEQAKEKGSEMQFCFAKALSSLKKFPLVLKSGKECAILQNFGKVLCSMIDKKIAVYLQQHPEFDMTKLGPSLSLNVPELNSKSKGSTSKNNNKPAASKKPVSKYQPAFRSGAYAILFAIDKKMQEPGFSGYMTKSQLQIEAQPYCDASFHRPEGNSHYTAWNSMATLVRNGLVSRAGSPAKFSLTEEGIIMARNLRESNENDLEIFKPVDGNQSSEDNNQLPVDIIQSPFENFVSLPPIEIDNEVILDDNIDVEIPMVSSNSLNSSLTYQPNSFDIILLVDKQETTGGLRGKVSDPTISELSQLGVMFEVRHLKVGDFAWICRPRRHPATGTNIPELILPYIVERKRMDDLARSIKDGRFHEQKFRLKQCGIQQKIYLIESLGDKNSDERTGLPLSTLRQAAANTQLIDEFLIRQTKNHRNSMQYLATFSKVLIDTYKNKVLKLCTKKNLTPLDIDAAEINLMSFEEFNKSSSKIINYTVRDMFIKHLVQLHGLTVEKASSITEKYSTPQSLRNAFMLHSSPESMLSEIIYGMAGRSIGPVLSKAIYELYMNSHLS